MLTYSVVVAKDLSIMGVEELVLQTYSNEEAAREHEKFVEELVLQTYSNEEAAREHEKFVEDNNCIVDEWGWDYVFIRETRIADVFEKGE